MVGWQSFNWCGRDDAVLRVSSYYEIKDVATNMGRFSYVLLEIRLTEKVSEIANISGTIIAMVSGGLRHSWALATRLFREPWVNPSQVFQLTCHYLYLHTFVECEHNVYMNTSPTRSTTSYDHSFIVSYALTPL